jgi:hypothetical protein
MFPTNPQSTESTLEVLVFFCAYLFLAERSTRHYVIEATQLKLQKIISVVKSEGKC